MYWKSPEEKYMEKRLEGLSPGGALRATKADSVIVHNPARYEKKVACLIRDALPKVGADNWNVAQTLANALKASKSDGEPDHRIRLDASRLIAQVTGQLDTSTKVAVQVNLSGKIADWIQQDATTSDGDGPLGDDLDPDNPANG